MFPSWSARTPQKPPLLGDPMTQNLQLSKQHHRVRTQVSQHTSLWRTPWVQTAPGGHTVEKEKGSNEESSSEGMGI